MVSIQFALKIRFADADTRDMRTVVAERLWKASRQSLPSLRCRDCRRFVALSRSVGQRLRCDCGYVMLPAERGDHLTSELSFMPESRPVVHRTR